MDLRGTIAPGFIEHGHLFGHHALVVDLAERPGAQPLDASLVVAAFHHHAIARVHFLPPRGRAAATWALCQAIAEADPLAECTAAFSAGDELPPDRVLSEWVLRIEAGERVPQAALAAGRSAGSVSVHGWPGHDLLDEVTIACDAPYGMFLVLTRSDIGAAKLWMADNQVTAWQIVPYHPLNGMYEAAEVDRSTGRP